MGDKLQQLTHQLTETENQLDQAEREIDNLTDEFEDLQSTYDELYQFLYLGTWISADPGDGSNQRLSISKSGKVFDVNYYDDVASSCGLDGSGDAIAASGIGSGIFDGNILGVDLDIYCQTDPESFLASTHADIVYNETTNTIEDSATIWMRP